LGGELYKKCRKTQRTTKKGSKRKLKKTLQAHRSTVSAQWEKKDQKNEKGLYREGISVRPISGCSVEGGEK